MNLRMSAIIRIITLLFLLSSCSSLPLPGTPTESLFVLCGDVERDLGTNLEGHGHLSENIRLSIVNMETGKETNLVYYPSKKYITAVLEPGRYAFNNKVEISVNYKGSNYINVSTQNIRPYPFLIEESTVFISPMVLRMSAMNGWYNFTSYSSMSASNVVKKKAMEELFNERRYKAWELYQLVGWEKEELK